MGEDLLPLGREVEVLPPPWGRAGEGVFAKAAVPELPVTRPRRFRTRRYSRIAAPRNPARSARRSAPRLDAVDHCAVLHQSRRSGVRVRKRSRPQTSPLEPVAETSIRRIAWPEGSTTFAIPPASLPAADAWRNVRSRSSVAALNGRLRLPSFSKKRA